MVFTMTDKASLRKSAKDIKKTLDLKQISDKIQDAVLTVISMEKHNTVMLYMSLPDEVETGRLFHELKEKGVTCCFPAVNGEFIKVFEGESFSPGKFGISEPHGREINPETIDVCIVPGVMFDENCHRLGRGGGYYDRFLSGLKCRKIGVCPDALLIDLLPCEDYDIDVDIVITEKRMVINGR